MHPITSPTTVSMLLRVTLATSGTLRSSTARRTRPHRGSRNKMFPSGSHSMLYPTKGVTRGAVSMPSPSWGVKPV